MSDLRLTAASAAAAAARRGRARVDDGGGVARDDPSTSVGTSSSSSSRVEAWLEESARASVGRGGRGAAVAGGGADRRAASRPRCSARARAFRRRRRDGMPVIVPCDRSRVDTREDRRTRSNGGARSRRARVIARRTIQEKIHSRRLTRSAWTSRATARTGTRHRSRSRRPPFSTVRTSTWTTRRWAPTTWRTRSSCGNCRARTSKTTSGASSARSCDTSSTRRLDDDTSSIRESFYQATAHSVRDRLIERWTDTQQYSAKRGPKRCTTSHSNS